MEKLGLEEIKAPSDSPEYMIGLIFQRYIGHALIEASEMPGGKEALIKLLDNPDLKIEGQNRTLNEIWTKKLAYFREVCGK